MKYLILFIALAALAALACSTPVYLPTATAAPLPTATATLLPTVVKVPTTPDNPPDWTAEIQQPVVNVRKAPNGAVIGTLRAGAQVEILECTLSWCQITKPAGWVWRGCLSDNPAKLGCRTK
jgi:hypothetical protein